MVTAVVGGSGNGGAVIREGDARYKAGGQERRGRSGGAAGGSRAWLWVGRGVLVAFAVYVAVPLYWLVISSMKSTHGLFTTSGLAPPGTLAHLGGNLEKVFTFDGGVFGRWMLNSIVYSGVAAGVGVWLCALAGYCLAFFEFRGKRVLFGSILTAMMLPGSALVLPIYLVDTLVLHLRGTPFGFVLPALVSAFGVYFMYVYLSGAGLRDLLDAARVDGAGEFRIVWEIVRGVAMPGVVTLAAIMFIVTWNNFFLALVVLNKPSQFPLSVGLVQWVTLLSGTAAGSGAGAVTYPEIIVGSLISILPLAILLTVGRRRIVAGLTLGSIAG